MTRFLEPLNRRIEGGSVGAPAAAQWCAMPGGPAHPSYYVHVSGAGEAPARAFKYQKLLDEGRYASVTEMAAAEKIERGYLGSLLRLTLLAPDIVRAILDGRAAALGARPRLLQPLPADWTEQCGVLMLEIGGLSVATDREGRKAAVGSVRFAVCFAPGGGHASSAQITDYEKWAYQSLRAAGSQKQPPAPRCLGD